MTSWTNQTKNSTSFTDQSKNSTSFANQTKNTTSFANQSKNTTTFSFQDRDLDFSQLLHEAAGFLLLESGDNILLVDGQDFTFQTKN